MVLCSDSQCWPRMKYQDRTLACKSIGFGDDISTAHCIEDCSSCLSAAESFFVGFGTFIGLWLLFGLIYGAVKYYKSRKRVDSATKNVSVLIAQPPIYQRKSSDVSETDDQP